MSNDSRPPRGRRPQDPNRQGGERRPPQKPPQGAPRREPRTGRRPMSQAELDEYNFLRKAQARRAQRNRKRIIALVAVVLLVVGIFAIKMAFDLGAGANTFYDGVMIDDLKLSSFNKQEAIEQLRLANTERINKLTVRLTYDGREWAISPEQLGVSINIEEVVEEAWALGHEGNIFARQAEINRLKKEPVVLRTEIGYDESVLLSRLAEIKASIDTPAVDATVKFDPDQEERFRITQEQNGRAVNIDELVLQVTNQLDNGFTSAIEIKPEVVYPQVYEETLHLSTKRIVRTTTELGDSSDARIHNVKTALANFNGLVVQPGQEVSFNQETGARGLEQGYQNAGVILDDEIVDGPGGGVCQVSTTLYQAVVKAGLEVVKSTKHSLTVSYVDPGTDAAVAWDYKDLVFKNNTEYPIFIEGKVSGKTVVVSIYGYPLEEGVSYEIISEVYDTIKPLEPQTVVDTAAELVTYTDETAVKKKARDGIKVRSYRVKKLNGEEVERVQLRDDYYKEVQGVIYQGATPRGGSTPTPSPTPGGEDEEDDTNTPPSE